MEKFKNEGKILHNKMAIVELIKKWFGGDPAKEAPPREVDIKIESRWKGTDLTKNIEELTKNSEILQKGIRQYLESNSILSSDNDIKEGLTAFEEFKKYEPLRVASRLAVTKDPRMYWIESSDSSTIIGSGLNILGKVDYFRANLAMLNEAYENLKTQFSEIIGECSRICKDRLTEQHNQEMENEMAKNKKTKGVSKPKDSLLARPIEYIAEIRGGIIGLLSIILNPGDILKGYVMQQKELGGYKEKLQEKGKDFKVKFYGDNKEIKNFNEKIRYIFFCVIKEEVSSIAEKISKLNTSVGESNINKIVGGYTSLDKQVKRYIPLLSYIKDENLIQTHFEHTTLREFAKILKL